ncbi:sodium:solute symporter family protein, partial [Acidobacteria bacterium AH-259-G07]|nr:sodium:solute symporter family protein [Acidobacteria bacterium AH-259-G07]
MEIATLDWIILVGYLFVITGIGIVAGLKVEDTDHYFLGKRRFGKWLMIGQSFGIGTHAEMPVSLAGAVYTMGASGIWFHWKNLFATPFYWIMAPVFRRIRRTTIAELTEDRYGLWMGGVYTVFALCYFTLNTASMLKGAAKVINQAVGGDVGVNQVVIAMTVIFIFYSFVGGLLATAWTDFFQGFLIIALSFMLIPLGWSAVGGLGGMQESLEAYKFSLAAPEGITLWVILMLTLNGLIGIMAQPHMLAAVGTGKDEQTCRVGFMYGNFVKRFCTVGWTLVGLIAAAMVAKGMFGTSSLADPEDAFGFAIRHLLFPGSLGLMIASVLAANMSTCSAFMVDSGALFTQGLYRKHMVTGKPDQYYLWVGRLSGFFVTMLGVLYALFLIERVLYSFLLTETLATFMGISLLGGIVWSRANRWGAIASLVTALATNFLLYYLRNERLDHWDADVFFMALLAGVAALVIVSLLTPPEPRSKTDSFFGRLQTPTGDPRSFSGETSVTTKIELDAAELSDPEPTREAAEDGQQSLLVNLLKPRKGSAGFGFWKAYRIDLTGFTIGWALA